MPFHLELGMNYLNVGGQGMIYTHTHDTKLSRNGKRKLIVWPDGRKVVVGTCLSSLGLCATSLGKGIQPQEVKKV